MIVIICRLLELMYCNDNDNGLRVFLEERKILLDLLQLIIKSTFIINYY